jgi:hypothetical protein
LDSLIQCTIDPDHYYSSHLSHCDLCAQGSNPAPSPGPIGIQIAFQPVQRGLHVLWITAVSFFARRPLISLVVLGVSILGLALALAQFLRPASEGGQNPPSAKADPADRLQQADLAFEDRLNTAEEIANRLFNDYDSYMRSKSASLRIRSEKSLIDLNGAIAEVEEASAAASGGSIVDPVAVASSGLPVLPDRRARVANLKGIAAAFATSSSSKQPYGWAKRSSLKQSVEDLRTLLPHVKDSVRRGRLDEQLQIFQSVLDGDITPWSS